MPNRFEGRIKRLEALQTDDVESLLDGLNYGQGRAILTYLMALLKGVEEPSDERLRQIPMNRERYSAALASIPPGVPERLMAAFIARVQRQDAPDHPHAVLAHIGGP
jgi:hypothetical protein